MKHKPLPVILIIDDVSDHIWLIDAMLGDSYRIMSARSPEEAWAALRNKLPDAILLDVFLGRQDGLELCQQLKADPRSSEIPVLMMSAQDSPELEQNCFIAGASDFVRKPFYAQVLKARLATQVRYKQALAILAQQSTTDGLTGIANRSAFDKSLCQNWEQASRSKGPIGLLLVDVDFFKKYNDGLGHQAGDTCLQAVAAAVESCGRRENDLAARYGGEEFAVILPNTDLAATVQIGEKVLRAVLDLKISHPSTKQAVSVSIGAASIYPRPSEHSDILVKQADQALYRAKAAGRAQVCT